MVRQLSRFVAGAFALATLLSVFPRRAAAAAQQPMRIVSLAPSVTETLFAIGAGDEVVGVSQYCNYPAAARTRPRVGTFLTPDLEAIVALRPTLVIGLGLSSDQRELHAIAEMSCPVMTVQDDSLGEIEASIERVGVRINRAAQAQALLEQLRAQIESVRDKVAGARRVRVLMVVGHQPLVAVGVGNFLDDLLRLAGADNIAASGSAQPWPRLSIEYILTMKPDVILDGQMGADVAASSNFWSRFPTIPAVRNHRVYGYPEDPIDHAGPRVGESLAMIAKLIHPERFAAETSR